MDAPIVSRMVYVDTPGSTAADPRRFSYQHRRRPLFPIEQDIPDPWGPGGQLGG